MNCIKTFAATTFNCLNQLVCHVHVHAGARGALLGGPSGADRKQSNNEHIYTYIYIYMYIYI